MAQKIQVLERKPKFQILTKEEVLKKIKEDEYVYIPSNEKDKILGGKVKVKDVWIDNIQNCIKIISEEISGIFELKYEAYHIFTEEQEKLKKEFDGKLAVQVFY